jgi:hypothetical protein
VKHRELVVQRHEVTTAAVSPSMLGFKLLTGDVLGAAKLWKVTFPLLGVVLKLSTTEI